MNCRNRKGSVTPNAHMKKAPSRAGNSVSKYADTHKLEKRRSPPGKLEVDGPAKVIEHS